MNIVSASQSIVDAIGTMNSCRRQIRFILSRTIKHRVLYNCQSLFYKWDLARDQNYHLSHFMLAGRSKIHLLHSPLFAKSLLIFRNYLSAVINHKLFLNHLDVKYRTRNGWQIFHFLHFYREIEIYFGAPTAVLVMFGLQNTRYYYYINSVCVCVFDGKVCRKLNKQKMLVFIGYGNKR